MKLKEMVEMEKMARKVNTSVGSLLVSTAPCYVCSWQSQPRLQAHKGIPGMMVSTVKDRCRGR